MVYLALYFSILIVGYIVGHKTKDKFDGEALAAKSLTVIMVVFVTVMGLRMGANREVIESFAEIGVISIVLTIWFWAGGIGGVAVGRQFMGMDRRAVPKHKLPQGEEEVPGRAEERGGPESADSLAAAIEEEEESEGGDHLTVLILGCVAAGILIGVFVLQRILSEAALETFFTWSSNLMTVGLCILMFSIGYGFGFTGTIVRILKGIGFKIFIVPIGVHLGTLLAAIAAGLFLSQITVKESIAIGYGYGWYTLAPILLENGGHEIAGAISFLHNVLREMGGIALIPLVARWIGYIECVTLPGAACGDVCLPIIKKATREDILAYAVVVSITQELATTVVVPLLV